MFNWIGRKFSRKLVLSFCIVVGFSLILTYLLSMRNFKNHLVGELKSSLFTQARQISVIIDPQAIASHNPKWQALAKKIDDKTGTRITFIRKDGMVTADSEIDWKELEKAENHSNRPEVIEALKNGTGSDIRHSHTLAADFLYVAIPYPSTEKISGVIRLAMPLNRVQEKISSFNKIILTSTVTVVLVGLIFVFVISMVVTRPLLDMTQTAKEISEGNLETRVQIRSSDEMGELAKTFNLMAEKIGENLKEIKNEKDEISAILNSMVEHVIAIDDKGRMLYLNPSSEKLFNLKNKEIQGKNFLEVIRYAPINDLLRSVLSRKTEIIEEIKFFLPEEKIFEARATPLSKRGKNDTVLLVLYDMTRIRKLEELRKDFVSNVSHELRTPLTSIRGFSETLLSGALSDTKNNREFVETIHSQAERLTRLVDDLLDLSAIESGKRKPHFASIDLKQLIKEIENHVRPLAEENGIRIETALSPSFPSIRGDREQFKQLFTNLIANAIKFNKKNGTVTVEASIEGDAVKISLKDTGIGIPERDLPRIFERFYLVDKARSLELGGTGLGLAIVKHIVEAHQGTIQVTSALNQGSCFLITLPYK